MYSIQSYVDVYRRQVREIGLKAFSKNAWPLFVSALHEANQHSCVIKHDNIVVGFALLSCGAERNNLPQGLEIAFLAIDEEYQGKGLGTGLLEYIKTLKYQHFWLYVAYSNPGAQRLYERCGFKIWRTIGDKEEGGYVMGYSHNVWAGRLRKDRWSRSKN